MSSGLPAGHPLFMHPILIQLLQATTSTTTKSGSSSSGSSYTLLIIVVVFAVVYFAFIRPRNQKARQSQARNRKVAVGDEVMSAGGIYGRVVAVDDDAVEVEVSPGVVLTFLPRAVSLRQPSSGGARAPEPTEPPAPVDEPWDFPTGTSPAEPAAGEPPVPGAGGGSGEERPGGTTPTEG